MGIEGAPPPKTLVQQAEPCKCAHIHKSETLQEHLIPVPDQSGKNWKG